MSAGSADRTASGVVSVGIPAAGDTGAGAAVTIRVWMENVYPDGTVETEARVTVPSPPASGSEEQMDAWADEHLRPLTGTGRTEGDAGYFLTITESDPPGLEGLEFDWGV